MKLVFLMHGYQPFQLIQQRFSSRSQGSNHFRGERSLLRISDAVVGVAEHEKCFRISRARFFQIRDGFPPALLLVTESPHPDQGKRFAGIDRQGGPEGLFCGGDFTSGKPYHAKICGYWR